MADNTSDSDRCLYQAEEATEASHTQVLQLRNTLISRFDEEELENATVGKTHSNSWSDSKSATSGSSSSSLFSQCMQTCDSSSDAASASDAEGSQDLAWPVSRGSRLTQLSDEVAGKFVDNVPETAADKLNEQLAELLRMLDNEKLEDAGEQSLYQWSVGSTGHEVGMCSPCVNMNAKTGCRNGAECRFCHLEHSKDFKIRNRYRPCKAMRDLCKQVVVQIWETYEDNPEQKNAVCETLADRSPYLRSVLRGMNQLHEEYMPNPSGANSSWQRQPAGARMRSWQSGPLGPSQRHDASPGYGYGYGQQKGHGGEGYRQPRSPIASWKD